MIHDLQSGEIGSYKLGRFYSESFSGEPYENDILSPRGVGRPGGLQQTLRLIVLMHETSHYVHDLSLGACMDLEYSMDHCHKLLVSGLNMMTHYRHIIRCPLFSTANRYQWMMDPRIRGLFEVVESIEAYSNRLLAIPPRLVQHSSNLRSYLCDSQACLDNISGQSLMEGLVAVKTMVALTERIQNKEDLQYLQEIREDIRIMPEDLPPIYHVARQIFDDTIGSRILNGNVFTGDFWPENYYNSSRLLCDTGFIYLADIALHIPPYEFIKERIKNGQNTQEDFIPAYRFCKALVSILRKGSFPMGNSMTHPEQFYNDLYDYVAGSNKPCWPSIKETNEAWMMKLAFMKESRKEAVDGYSFRMLVEKNQRPHGIVMEDALLNCWLQGVPVFHLTPTGFKRLLLYPGSQSYCIMYETPDMMVEEVFYKDYPLWKDHLSADIEDTNNGDLLSQEIIYRSLCWEIHNAILYKRWLTCPFARRGCSKAVPTCQKVTQLANIPQKKCVLRDYLKQDGLSISYFIWI